jgi:formate-dependent nitrite reductase membrane component NrfD
MTELERYRNNFAVDPELHIWGWEIPVYLFLGGAAAGIMILAAAAALRAGKEPLSKWSRWLPFAAPLLISLGMGALFLDLAFKAHVYRFYLTLRPLSPMSWGSWILIAIYPSTVLLGLGLLSEAEVEWLSKRLRLRSALSATCGWAAERRRALAWANVALGVGLGAYTGLLLGTLAARPAWNSVLLAPLFLASGLSTGAAFMMLLPLRETEHEQLRRWDVWAIGAELLLLGFFLLGLGVSGGATGAAAMALFAGGKFTAAFWSLVVGAGLLVPLVLEILESRRGLRPTFMAPALILVGGLSLRWIIVLAGQTG